MDFAKEKKRRRSVVIRQQNYYSNNMAQCDLQTIFQRLFRAATLPEDIGTARTVKPALSSAAREIESVSTDTLPDLTAIPAAVPVLLEAPFTEEFFYKMNTPVIAPLMPIGGIPCEFHVIVEKDTGSTLHLYAPDHDILDVTATPLCDRAAITSAVTVILPSDDDMTMWTGTSFGNRVVLHYGSTGVVGLRVKITMRKFVQEPSPNADEFEIEANPVADDANRSQRRSVKILRGVQRAIPTVHRQSKPEGQPSALERLASISAARRK